jgi:hypothetical protein
MLPLHVVDVSIPPHLRASADRLDLILMSRIVQGRRKFGGAGDAGGAAPEVSWKV